MSTLLRSWGLILNVDTRCPFLNKQLSQLHNRGQSSVSSISVCDDGSEVIDVGEFGTVSFRRRCHSFFALLPVMKELGLE
jgi:hypothetical protein